MREQEPPVHTAFGFQYVRTSEMPESDRLHFEHWMFGQTRPLIPDIDPQDAAYMWDYRRWREHLVGKPVVWD